MLISLPGQPAGKPSSSNPQPPPPRLADLSVQSAPSWGTASVQPSPCKSCTELGSSVGSSRDDAGAEAAGRWRLSSAARLSPRSPAAPPGPGRPLPAAPAPCSKLLSRSAAPPRPSQGVPARPHGQQGAGKPLHPGATASLFRGDVIFLQLLAGSNQLGGV